MFTRLIDWNSLEFVINIFFFFFLSQVATFFLSFNTLRGQRSSLTFLEQHALLLIHVDKVFLNIAIYFFSSNI